jgi:nitroreductase
MDVFECIDTRRSVRKFAEGDIPLEKLVQILDAGTDAPSAGNTQPWEFIIVTEQGAKDKLYEAALRQEHVKKSSVLIAVLANMNRSALRYGKRGKELYCIQDTAACMQNMLLTVHALGLAGCWVGAFDEAAVKNILGIADEEIRVVAMLPIGNPISYEENPKPPRMELDKVAWAERYGQKPKWILGPQRRHRFEYEPLDTHLIKAKEKIDSKITELDKKLQPKKQEPFTIDFKKFFKKFSRKKI